MENTTASQVGQVVGVVLALGLIVGVFVLFIVSLIMSLRTGKKGWIITASISGLPVAAFVVLLIVAFGLGIVKGLNNHAANQPVSTQTASDLMTAAMTAVPGSDISYQISYPWLDSWNKVASTNKAFDQLYNIHDAYVGVIAEGIGVGTPEKICDISQKNLSTNAQTSSFTVPQPVNIDSHSWLTYDASATVSGVDLKYRFYVYADTNYTFQIICWSGPAGFDKMNGVFDRVAKSFQMPKAN